MKITDKIAKVASDLDNKGLSHIAAQLDAVLDDILASDQSQDLHTQEPEATGGSGPLPSSALAADDGELDEEEPAKDIDPEQQKARLVKRIAKKVLVTCEEQRFFKDVPRMLKDVQTKKMQPKDLHDVFKLQAKRLIQCGLELMDKLLNKYQVDLSDHEKLALVRKLGLEILDNCGCHQFKYDLVSAIAEYKNEGHIIQSA